MEYLLPFWEIFLIPYYILHLIFVLKIIISSAHAKKLFKTIVWLERWKEGQLFQKFTRAMSDDTITDAYARRLHVHGCINSKVISMWWWSNRYLWHVMLMFNQEKVDYREKWLTDVEQLTPWQVRCLYFLHIQWIIRREMSFVLHQRCIMYCIIRE